MGKLSTSNLKKAFQYLKRNGAAGTFYAVLERLGQREEYRYLPPSPRELEKQRGRHWEEPPLFSIVVPLYRTPERFLRAMADSVLKQTYPYLELVLADATEDDSVERLVKVMEDDRIRYIRLEGNRGISENTNRGLEKARGDYIGLLDHDDLLTPDALYLMADRIEKGKRAGTEKLLLYSDEDKCDEDAEYFYEPHFKEEFNLDLLLSNNYICHFLVMESDFMRKLGLRSAYDGAQDFDLVLRAAGELEGRENAAEHIPRVLYHWRCHTGSTAENPESKRYAYDAGRRAVQAYADHRGWQANAVDLAHVGYYALVYRDGILRQRRDVGLVGGRLLSKGKIAGGIYREDGTCPYETLSARYSGYMHRAVLLQDAEAVDIRFVRVRPECRGLLEQVTGAPYLEDSGTGCYDWTVLPEDTDFKSLSLALGEAVRSAGYRVVWDPSESRKLK